MIGRGFRLGTLFGIPIRIDYSWGVILFLLTASLAMLLGQRYPYLALPLRFSLGFAAALLLFASVLAHEMSHAVVALKNDVGIRGITLFIFGGAAEMTEEPKSAGAELKIAIAGPLMSLALALVFAVMYRAGLGTLPLPLMEIVQRLSHMNLMLVAFNIVPGFPLDGGRVLRATLWGIWGTLSAATRVASSVGSFFGTSVVMIGFVWIFAFGNFIGGLWFVLIGFFLRNAARASFQQLVIRQALEGVRARDVMNVHVLTVRPGASVAEAVEEVILPKGVAEVPVVEFGRLVGVLRLRDVRGHVRERWPELSVSEIMSRDVLEEAITPDDEALDVLTRLGLEDRLLPVVDDGAFVGVVTRRDLLRRLELQLELGR